MRTKGFSIVELSIVLVVLGLLVGGVVAGKSLIRAAALRSVTSDYARYFSATQAFHDKYNELPGDMPNATNYWGIAGGSGSDAACSTTSSTTTTCNGNGDGQIIDSTGSAEEFRFWQQLSDAGIIGGSFTGITDGSLIAAPGKNVPLSKLTGNPSWMPYYVAAQSGSTTFFDGSYGNIFYFFIAGTSTWSGMLKPEDAWNLDKKMDDGNPGTGSVRSNWGSTFSGTAAACTNAANSAATTAAYNLGDSGADCGLWFRTKWQ